MRVFFNWRRPWEGWQVYFLHFPGHHDTVFGFWMPRAARRWGEQHRWRLEDA